MRRTRQHSTARPIRRGFTLIELLIVIGIIGVLVGITLVVGSQVMAGGRKSVTLDTIRVLDSSLDAYIHSKGENPPPTWSDPAQPNVKYLAADALDPASNQINGLVIYMLQASEVPDAKGILDKVPSKFLQVFNDAAAIPDQPQKKMMVVDGWGKPIRYVHPAFQGSIYDLASATTPNPNNWRDMSEVLGAPPASQSYAITRIRRNHTAITATPTTPDSDGGTCVGARPYFYSAGLDGKVGLEVAIGTGAVNVDFNKDNVYTTRPNLPQR
jgi:prepilin-type N-terminal cleavage/methylation domain-containing protein